MTPFIGPGAARHPIYHAPVAPPRATHNRRGRSTLRPEAPEFVPRLAVRTHGELARLILHRIYNKTLSILIEGPSRDDIRSLITAIEAEQKKSLERFKAVKAMLDRSRRDLAQMNTRFLLEQTKDYTNTRRHATRHALMEQQIIELEMSWDDAGRKFKALGEKIEELLGELADAR